MQENAPLAIDIFPPNMRDFSERTADVGFRPHHDAAEPMGDAA